MKTPLYQQLYDYVLDEIQAGRLKPGDRILSEKELAERFQVSRITSKKALELLVQADVIERIPGKGSFVSSGGAAGLTASERMPGNGLHKHRPIVGLVLPDFSETYGLELLHAIESACSERNFHLMMKRTYGSLDIETKAMRDFVQDGVAGIIMFPVHGEYYNPDLLRLVLDGFPLVLVDRYLSGIPASAVYTDNHQAGRIVTHYLLDSGHRHVAFIAPPSEHTSTIEDRLQGYKDSFIEHNLRFEPNYVFTDLYSTLPMAFYGDKIARDEAALRAFIEQHPEITAFVISEYNLARVLGQVIATLGKRDQYAIICFDSPVEPFGKPRFSHVKQDETAMGRTAVDLLAAQFEGKTAPTNHVVDFRLVAGRSTPEDFEQYVDKTPHLG